MTACSTAYGAVDDAVSLNVLDRALDLGVNSNDTSNRYCGGYSGGFAGAGVAQAPRHGHHRNQGRPDSYDTGAYSAAEVQASIEGSLRRLRTGYVDVVQVHSPSSIEALKQAEAMATLPPPP